MNFSTMSTWDLYVLSRSIGFELLKRIWWIYVLVIVIATIAITIWYKRH